MCVPWKETFLNSWTHIPQLSNYRIQTALLSIWRPHLRGWCPPSHQANPGSATALSAHVRMEYPIPGQGVPRPGVPPKSGAGPGWGTPPTIWTWSEYPPVLTDRHLWKHNLPSQALGNNVSDEVNNLEQTGELSTLHNDKSEIIIWLIADSYRLTNTHEATVLAAMLEIW